MDEEADKIAQLITLSSELILFADSAHDEISDDGCLCLFGLAKDCAYKIRAQAQHEHRIHAARRQKAKRKGER